MSHVENNSTRLSISTLNRKILIVDDEPLICWSIKNSFNITGFSVDVTTKSQEAFQMLQHNFYDIVITDLKIDQHNGYDIACEAKKLNPTSIVILMTAYADEYVKIKAKQSGIDLYLEKPLRLSAINKKLVDILNNSTN